MKGPLCSTLEAKILWAAFTSIAGGFLNKKRRNPSDRGSAVARRSSAALCLFLQGIPAEKRGSKKRRAQPRPISSIFNATIYCFRSFFGPFRILLILLYGRAFSSAASPPWGSSVSESININEGCFTSFLELGMTKLSSTPTKVAIARGETSIEPIIIL